MLEDERHPIGVLPGTKMVYSFTLRESYEYALLQFVRRRTFCIRDPRARAVVTSTQAAETVLIAAWAVATMVLTSAQLRVAKRRSWRRYIVAWLFCTLLLGALLSAMDFMVGRAEPMRILADVMLAAVISGLALAAGARWIRRPWWAQTNEPLRTITLLLIQGLVVLVAAYPFI
jgi:hypothetical protein